MDSYTRCCLWLLLLLVLKAILIYLLIYWLTH
jgi:hypothetical protein